MIFCRKNYQQIHCWLYRTCVLDEGVCRICFKIYYIYKYMYCKPRNYSCPLIFANFAFLRISRNAKLWILHAFMTLKRYNFQVAKLNGRGSYWAYSMYLYELKILLPLLWIPEILKYTVESIHSVYLTSNISYWMLLPFHKTVF